MPRYDDSAAYAANWRTVLAADFGLGVLALLGGVFVLLFLQIFVGALLCLIAVAYLVLVAQRSRKWKRLRAEADL